MNIHAELYILAQCLIALVLGGLLGWEREMAGKWAGLRTHMLVCFGVVLFLRLGQFLLKDTAGEVAPGIVRGDPIRLIEAIATAIAFLGAGTIIRDRDRNMARGLTTAASLLVAAAVGIAIGLDCYVVAAGTTLLALTVLRGMNWVEKRFVAKSKGNASESRCDRRDEG